MKGIQSYGRLILIISVVASIITLGGIAFPSSLGLTNLFGLDMLHEHIAVLPKHEAEGAPLPKMIDDLLKQNLKAGDAVSNRYLKIDEDFIDPDNHCEFCQRYEYTPGPAGIAGIGYGPEDGKIVDLSGAKKVFFFVMGEDGGEKLRFKVGGKDENANVDTRAETNNRTPSGNPATRESNPITNSMINGTGPALARTADLFPGKAFAKTTEEVSLTDDWKRFEIDVADVDMGSVENPFAIEVFGPGKQIFYVKGITFDSEAAVDPLPTIEINATIPTGNLTALNQTEIIRTNNTATNSSEIEDEQPDNSTILTNATAPEAVNQTSSTPADSKNPAEGNNTDQENEEVSSNENSTSTDTDNGTRLANVEPAENEKPVAIVQPDEILAHPGDTVILDATSSQDPEGAALLFSWEANDPGIEIAGNADIPTPTIIISQNIEEDAELTIELVVSDGNLESIPSPVTIFVDYFEPIDAPEDNSFSDTEESILHLAPVERNRIEQDLTDFGEVDFWNPNADCIEQFGDNPQDIATCLADNSDDTTVSADEQSADVLLFDPSEEVDSDENGTDMVINYVSAEIKAKSSPESDESGDISTAFVSLVLYDGEYHLTPPISILPDSFDTYSYRWTTNPNGEDRWDKEELEQPILIGYIYFSGGSDVEISEFSATISYFAAATEAENTEEETEQTEEETEQTEEETEQTEEETEQTEETTDDSAAEVAQESDEVDNIAAENSTSDSK